MMNMLESNYRTWCAQNGVSLDEGRPEGDDSDSEMDLDRAELDDGPWAGFDDELDDMPDFFREEEDRKAKLSIAQSGKRKKKGKVAELVREKVRKVLEEVTQLADKRARNCEEGEFLKILWAFNQEGIHFN